MATKSTGKTEANRKALKAALEQVIAAGHTVREFSEFVVDKFGSDYIPHLRQFLREVGNGEIRIKGLGEKARQALTGHHVNAQEREAMIRETAYFLAEQRGFAPGHEVNDWVAAETEVDQYLALEIGLIHRGRQALSATATSIGKEFRDVTGTVTAWLEQHSTARDRDIPQSIQTEEIQAEEPIIESAAPVGKAGKVKSAAPQKYQEKNSQNRADSRLDPLSIVPDSVAGKGWYSVISCVMMGNGTPELSNST